MTFSYDEVNDFEDTDDFDETDDFEEEPQDVFLAEDDDDDPDTALSQAFRQAAGTIVDEDETDEEEDDAEADDGTEPEEADTPEDDATEEDKDADADADTYEQQLIEPVEALLDENEDDLDENEDDLEVELPPLELVPTEPEVEFFRPKEQSNAAYRDARTAYYEENDYQRAIEKFNEAIAYEVQSTGSSLTDANEIVAKSKYWQAEAYVKLQDLSQAIQTFENLAKTCQGHYLSLAAQRRADQLNTKNS